MIRIKHQRSHVDRISPDDWAGEKTLSNNPEPHAQSAYPLFHSELPSLTDACKYGLNSLFHALCLVNIQILVRQYQTTVERGITPVIAAPLLLVITLLLAVVIGTITLGFTTLSEPEALTVIDVSSDPTTNSVTIVNKGPRELDVRELTIVIEIDHQPLSHQLTVPFFSHQGYHSGPTGPFNSATDPYWTTGEEVSFRIASTNSPSLTPGVTLTITLSINDSPIAQSETIVN